MRYGNLEKSIQIIDLRCITEIWICNHLDFGWRRKIDEIPTYSAVILSIYLSPALSPVRYKETEACDAG